jgi:FKBP-type peptidyl-prolyl cis-trans isomerase
VIVGLEVAVQRMKVGQVCEVTVPHLYAYGQRGHYSHPEIPPRSTLIFRNLELLEVVVVADGRKTSFWRRRLW